MFEVQNFDSGAKSEKVGSLAGLAEETFALNWNRKSGNLICSGAGNIVCIWDINSIYGNHHMKR